MSGWRAEGVVVEVHLGVEGQDVALPGDEERVDLGERGVRPFEGLVQAGDEPTALLERLARQAELEGELPGLEGAASPVAGSTYSLKMSSGVSAATFSISTPPSVEAMTTAASRARSMTTPR